MWILKAVENGEVVGIFKERATAEMFAGSAAVPVRLLFSFNF